MLDGSTCIAHTIIEGRIDAHVSGDVNDPNSNKNALELPNSTKWRVGVHDALDYIMKSMM